MQVTSISRRDSPPPVAPRDPQEFLAEAFQRFHLAEEAESQVRRDALEDFRFKVGDQWDHDIFQARQKDARPCLTMNRLRQFTRMVTNEQRQQRPSIQVNPVGDESDIQTAEVIQGLCRHVEVQSDAEIAYDTAFEHMATGGFGYFRIRADYIDDESDEQEIFIERIKNPFSVYVDPRAIKPDYSDALYYFIVEDMATELYKASYPDSELAALSEFTSVGNQMPGWISYETIRVAEYFYVDLKKDKDSKRMKRTVRWAKINAIELLEEERDVPCRWIPIIPVLGDDDTVDGKRTLVGLVRDAKDPQRMYNFQISAAAEMIALAPKAPWVVAEGQLENHESQWEQSNRRNFATLTFKPISTATGQPFGPPQRNTAEPPIMAMSAMIKQADNDLKAVTGIYDASLGQQGPEQSGKAVMLRQRQSDVANLNFTDNLARSIRFAGKILIDMFPRVYTTAHVRRIVKPDGTAQQVGIMNSAAGPPDMDEAQQLVMGASRVFDIGVGRYDVSVTVGPTYQSKRQEAAAGQVALISAYPQIMPIAGDILVRNFDWPQATEIADRMKKMLPPALHDDPKGDPQAQLQQAQAQLNQLQQQNQQLLGALQAQNQMMNQKHLEAQTKTNVALIDNITRLNVAHINASKDQDTAQADREMDMLQTMMGQAHDAGSQAADHTHDRYTQFSDQQHERMMAAQPQPMGPEGQSSPAPAPSSPQAPPQMPGGPAPQPLPGQGPGGQT
jgi:hypothetical protein